MSDKTEAPQGEDATRLAYNKPAYRGVVLTLLTIVYIFNFVDRQILNILSESIKADLDLDDSQLGLLTGFVFAVFYVSMGIPIARLADKFNRVKIITISLALWSAMTALSGMASNFTQLLLARIGVGVGEAGGSPPAHSMLSDIYPPAKRAFAFSIYSSGIYFGMALGYGLGGWLDANVGWKAALMIVGIPGVVLALILILVVREPLRGLQEQQKQSMKELPGFVHTLKHMWQFASFRYISLGAATAAFTGYGIGNFMPNFFIRIHDYPREDLGVMIGLVAGIGGAIGIIGSGWLAQRLGARDVRYYMWVPALAVPLAFLSMIGTLIAPDMDTVLWVYPIAGITSACYLPACIAMVHGLVPANMRAMSSAVLFFILNLIGLGLGPYFIGWLSTLLSETMGEGEGLRMSMIIGMATIFLSMAFFLLAARSLPADLKRAGANNS